jgi:F0F1-type ATP synthase delta subunit
MSNVVRSEVELTDAELGAIYGAIETSYAYYKHGLHAQIKEEKTFTGSITIKFDNFEIDKTFKIEPVEEKKLYDEGIGGEK